MIQQLNFLYRSAYNQTDVIFFLPVVRFLEQAAFMPLIAKIWNSIYPEEREVDASAILSFFASVCRSSLILHLLLILTITSYSTHCGYHVPFSQSLGEFTLGAVNSSSTLKPSTSRTSTSLLCLLLQHHGSLEFALPETGVTQK